MDTFCFDLVWGLGCVVLCYGWVDRVGLTWVCTMQPPRVRYRAATGPPPSLSVSTNPNFNTQVYEAHIARVEREAQALRCVSW